MGRKFFLLILLFTSFRSFSQCSDSIAISLTQEDYYQGQGQWDNRNRILNSYNSQGFNTGYEYQNWNAATSSWTSSYQSTMMYDLQGRITDSISEFQSTPRFKYQFTYDANGLKATDTIWTWDGAQWNYGYYYNPYYSYPSLIEYSYDINHHDSVNISYLYNGSWILNTRTLSTMDSIGLNADIISQRYDTSMGTWINLTHDVYSYNAQNQLIYHLLEYWNLNDTAFYPSSEFTTASDSAGNIIYTESVSGYDPEYGWFYHDYAYFTYDSLNRLVAQHQFHSHHSGSDGTTDYYYTYDSNGRLVLMEYIHDTDINYSHQRTFYSNTNKIMASAGGSQKICSGTSLQVYGSALGGCGNLHYLWSPTNAFSDSSVSNPIVRLNESSMLYLTVTDDSGNSAVDSTFIELKSHHSLTLVSNPANSIFCDGASIQLSIDTTGSNVYYWYLLRNSTPYLTNIYNSLLWNIDTSSSYSVVSYTRDFCMDTSTEVVIRKAIPLSIVSTAKNATCTGCSDGNIILTITGGELPLSISWTPGYGQLSGDSIVNLPFGQYSVCVDDAIHCKTFCDSAEVLEIPSGIINTNYQINTIFYPMPLHSTGVFYLPEKLSNANMLLRDIQGKVVRICNVHSGFNSFERKDMSSGMYFYFIESDSKIVANGKLIIAE